MADDVKDDARDQGFGLFVPMCFGFGFIEHQSIGERHRIFGQIEAVRIKPVERIVARRCPPRYDTRLCPVRIARRCERAGEE